MKAIMLKNNALTIQCESRFEEEWLSKIIGAVEKGENKGFKVFASTSRLNGYGFLTIEPMLDKNSK